MSSPLAGRQVLESALAGSRAAFSETVALKKAMRSGQTLIPLEMIGGSN